MCIPVSCDSRSGKANAREKVEEIGAYEKIFNLIELY